MNGKQAKKLRKIARGLKLPAPNSYAPVGREEYVEARNDNKRSYTAGIKRRPVALQACERRAYKEAKSLYKGIDTTSVDPEYRVILSPSQAESLAGPDRSFADKMVDSIKQQPEGPSA